GPDGQPLPLRACVNAFGAGGSNAHLVVEQAPVAAPPAKEDDGPQLLLLSAADEAALERRIAQLAAFLREHRVPLGEVARTLALGRDAMEERFAFIAENTAGAIAALEAWRGGDGFRGRAGEARSGSSPGPDASPEALARHWVAGGDVD